MSTMEVKTEEPQATVTSVVEFDKKEERRLLRKLDFFILTYSCFSYFFNFLDRSAFANAYVAGLKEDLHLEGNQYSILLSMTSAGLVIGQVPNALVLQKIAPRLWLPSMVILWGALTMCGAACKNFTQFAAVRFFMGLAEASTYAGCVYVIGSWYTPKELAKRTAIFTIAGQVGTMFAGAMMAAIERTMSGHSGLKGWQWVFLIDGIITCPIAVFGYLYFPDTPERTRASYLSKRERQIALSRVPPKRADSNSIALLPLFKRVCCTPAFWCLTCLSITCAALQAFPLQGMFLLWLKNFQDRPFTQTNINTYPLGIQAVGIVAELVAGYYLDKTGNRIITALTIAGIQLTCAIILIIPNVPFGAAFFAFYASGTSYAVNPLMYQWANVLLGREGDDAKRGVVLASMVGAGILLWTWWGIVFYPATDAPYWKKGSIALMCMCFLFLSVVMVVRWLDRRGPEKVADGGVVAETEVDAASADEENAPSTEKKSN